MGSDWLELVRDLTSDGPVRVDLSRECREEYVSLRILTIATAGEICDAVEALREKNADIDLTSLEIDPTGIYFDVTIPENCVKELIAFCDGSDIIEINWDAMLDDYSASDEEGYHD